MRALADQTFHKMQALPFSMLPGLEDTAETNVLRIRYDACMSRGEARVFAVINTDDLAPLLDRIRFPQPPGIGLPGSDMFFMQGPDGLALYIDTDEHEDLWICIMDEANDAGIDVVQAKCDMDMIRRVGGPFEGLPGDVDPPAEAGYAAAGFAHVPIETGFNLLERKRSPEVAPHDPSVPGL